MDLDAYFDSTDGQGVLATADAKGKVDLAIYSKPRFLDKKNVVFIMSDRLTHHNLQTNPNAAYLFQEAREGYNGKRLILRKVADKENGPDVEVLRRKCTVPEGTGKRLGRSYTVKFRIKAVRPLVGEGA
ncbi:MAG: pyridoxamine 5'-phosphate oxidase family protein [Elusimicrobia bacterium]|nr:pyridoxamine 5'-phosphate oxidase family protein [Elusimicrobiota bacterium]